MAEAASEDRAIPSGDVDRRRSNVGGGGKARSAVRHAALAASEAAPMLVAPGAGSPADGPADGPGVRPVGGGVGIAPAPAESPAPIDDLATRDWSADGDDELYAPPGCVWRFSRETSEAIAPGELGETDPLAAAEPVLPCGTVEDGARSARWRDGAG